MTCSDSVHTDTYSYIVSVFELVLVRESLQIEFIYVGTSARLSTLQMLL